MRSETTPLTDGHGEPDRSITRPTRRKPLAGVLVADFSRVLAGPYATMLLGDLGADVIKVERPGDGDDARAWGPPFADGESTYFQAANRAKRSITLDLRDPADREVAQRLAGRADVMVENFRPGAIERLGLGYEGLVDRNPGLVYCAISGFGRDKGAGLPAYDFLIQAVGGLMSMTGEPDREPMKVGFALVDVLTGLFATIGILAALQERERSGHGQRVDLSLLSSLLSSLVNQTTGLVAADHVPSRLGNDHPSLAPYQLVPTADVPIVIAAGNPRQFATLAAMIGAPELVDDPRFISNAARVEHREALREVLEAAFVTRPSSEWLTRANGMGLPAGPVNDLRQAFEFAKDLGVPTTVEVPRSDGRTIKQVVNPLSFSATPIEYRVAPPLLGADGDEIRSELEASEPNG